MNFLHAIPGTVFENLPPLSAEEALRIIALYRILLPETTIRICGGRPKILGKWQNAIFHAGANALMIGDYLTTFGQTPAEDIEMIARLGLVCASVWDARLNVR